MNQNNNNNNNKECHLNGDAIEVQCAPYVLINQKYVFSPLEKCHQKHTAKKCNQTEVSMNVTTVGKKGFSLIL